VILVDTSVWIDHFRQGEPRLIRLLEMASVVMHPWIVGEIALGNLRNRGETLALLMEMPQLPVASTGSVLRLIGEAPLHGLGIGYVDAQLLAAAHAATDTSLWTRDRTLLSAAQTLQIASV